MRYFIYSILLALFSLPLFSQQDDLYRTGQEQYRNDEFDGARQSLEQFRDEQALSAKADDALWYLGRIYWKLNLFGESEAAFLTVLKDETSNRRTESLSDLLKLYDHLDREDDIPDAAVPLIFSLKPDNYFNRAIPVLMKGYLLAGVHARSGGFGSAAEDVWTAGIDTADTLLAMELDEDTIETLMEYRVKFAVRLAGLGKTAGNVEEWLAKAEEYLAEMQNSFPGSYEKSAALEQDIAEVSAGKTKFNYAFAAAGAYNSYASTPSWELDLKLSGSLPISPLMYFDWDGRYIHDPFAFKTFNFPADETGNTRLIQAEESLSASAGIRWGSKYYMEQSISLEGDLSLAEDDGDTNYKGKIRHQLDANISRFARIGTDTYISLVTYPDYINAGNTIDYAKANFSPYYYYQLTPDSWLKIDYTVFWKYYLDAHFDTAAGGTDPGTRQYLSNAFDLELGSEVLPGLDVSLGAGVEYLKTFNYDYLVSGTPADQFVADYFDYMSYQLKADTSYKKGSLRSGIGLILDLRNFINYPARDELQAFTGETRQDTGFEASWDNLIILADSDTRGRFSLLFDLSYRQSVSNHTYEDFYATNYSFWGMSVGFRWED